MRLLLAGGGTGGHLFPAVALAEQLLRQSPQSNVLFVGTKRGLEAELLPRLGLPLKTVDICGLVGRGVGAKLRVGPKLVKSFFQARKILRDFQPAVVVGVGGYASAPVVLAAKWLKIPVVLHEQNAAPGLTNRLLARWAERICLSVEEAKSCLPAERCLLTGNPLRQGMEAVAAELPDQPSLLVFGGSQGASAINQTMTAALPLIEELRGQLKIVHQTGSAQVEEVRTEYRRYGWDDAEVVSFIDEMDRAYEAAQLVVCRAGATTLAELTVVGRPSILVPFPYATADHQTANATALANKGAATVVPQKELTPERLACELLNRLQNRDDLTRMAAAARKLGCRGAAETILEVCQAVARREG